MTAPTAHPERLLYWHDAPNAGPPVVGMIAPSPDGAAGAESWGAVLGASALDNPPLDALPRTAPRLILRSIASSAEPRGDDDDARLSFDAWGPAGRAGLDRGCERLRDLAERAGVVVCLRPDARGALSDIPSCVAFLKRWSGTPLALLLDPLDLLTLEMLPRAPEHLERIGASLIGAPGLSAIFIRRPETTSTIPSQAIRALALLAATTSTPVIVPAADGPAWARELDLL